MGELDEEQRAPFYRASDLLIRSTNAEPEGDEYWKRERLSSRCSCIARYTGAPRACSDAPTSWGGGHLNQEEVGMAPLTG